MKKIILSILLLTLGVSVSFATDNVTLYVGYNSSLYPATFQLTNNNASHYTCPSDSFELPPQSGASVTCSFTVDDGDPFNSTEPGVGVSVDVGMFYGEFNGWASQSYLPPFAMWQAGESFDNNPDAVSRWITNSQSWGWNLYDPPTGPIKFEAVSNQPNFMMKSYCTSSHSDYNCSISLQNNTSDEPPNDYPYPSSFVNNTSNTLYVMVDNISLGGLGDLLSTFVLAPGETSNFSFNGTKLADFFDYTLIVFVWAENQQDQWGVYQVAVPEGSSLPFFVYNSGTLNNISVTVGGGSGQEGMMVFN